jgi:hypothetical protein
MYVLNDTFMIIFQIELSLKMNAQIIYFYVKYSDIGFGNVYVNDFFTRWEVFFEMVLKPLTLPMLWL